MADNAVPNNSIDSGDEQSEPSQAAAAKARELGRELDDLAGGSSNQRVSTGGKGIVIISSRGEK